VSRLSSYTRSDKLRLTLAGFCAATLTETATRRRTDPVQASRDPDELEHPIAY